MPLTTRPLSRAPPPPPSPPPPSLYDTSTSSAHEESITATVATAMSSGGYPSATGSGYHHQSPRSPYPSQQQQQQQPPRQLPQRFFPKSHPPNSSAPPKYDPRAYRRNDEHHRPVRSEPIVNATNASVQSYHRSLLRRGRIRDADKREDPTEYPDPEVDVHRLEQLSRSGGPLPAFSLVVDGVASEVALSSGNRTAVPSYQRLLPRRGDDWKRRLDGDPRASKKVVPPSSRITPSTPVLATTSKLTAREAVAAAAWHRRQRQEQQQQQQQPQTPPHARQEPPTMQHLAGPSSSNRSSESNILQRAKPSASSQERRQPPAPGNSEDGACEDDAAAAAAARGSDDWQRRAEIETPRPARVCELKRRLWDSRESLLPTGPATPHLNAQPELHYDRPGLDRHWRHWHGEDHPTGTGSASQERFRASAARARSLSPRAIARLSLTSGPSAGPPAPSTPRSHGPAPQTASKMFQSRFVQAAQRHLSSPSAAAPRSPQQQQPPRATSSCGAVLSPVSASRRPEPRRGLEPATASPRVTVNQAKQGPTGTTEQLATEPPHPSSSPPSLVADLVAQLQNLPRDDPHQAWVELDAILQAHAEAESKSIPETRHAHNNNVDPIRGEQEEKAAAARDDRIPNLSIMATKSHPDDEPTADPSQGHDNVGEEDDEDDDATSVSSITNPTYGPAGTLEPQLRSRDYMVSAKSAGQPRPSAMLAPSRTRRPSESLLRPSAPATATALPPSLQPQSQRHNSRRNRDRSPPPAAIHVGSAAKDTRRPSSYHKLAEEEGGETEGDGPAPRCLESDFAATSPTGHTPAPTETSPAAPLNTGSEAASAPPPESAPRSMEWNLLSSSRSAPGAACPCPTDADTALNTSVQVATERMSKLVAANPVSCAATSATATTDPTSQAATALAEKIRRWDEMSEPDFCPNVCSHSRSTDKDERFASLADGFCPRDLLGQATASRRHHPWDASIPVSMGRVEVHETSMEHAVGVETQYSMKYEDVVSEASVSVEASSGPQRYSRLPGTPSETRECQQLTSVAAVLEDPISNDAEAPRQDAAAVDHGHPPQSRGGELFDVNPKLVPSPSAVWETASRKSSERQQAYARNLADDFDSAWVSLPSSTFFPAEQGTRKHASGPSKDTSTSKSVASNETRSTEGQTNRYQKFQATEEHKKRPTGVETPPRSGSIVSKGIGVVGVEKGPHAENRNMMQKVEVSSLSTNAPHPVDTKNRRGLRKFLKLRQGSKAAAASQGSASTSSRSYLQSVSLDLETAEMAPPNRGRSHLDLSSPDRLRSHSLEERRMRNPNIAKKFNRLLRVYDENDDRKQLGHI